MSALEALGVVNEVIGLLSFAADMIPEPPEKPSVAFNFFIGSDGAHNPDEPNSSGGLSNAGGEIPDIRLWEENGDFIGIQVNDGATCRDGAVVCGATLADVAVQPAYALLTGNPDALCVAYATVAFPGGTSRYAATLGGLARACSSNFEGRGGPWYWSDIWIQPADGASFLTECAWIDADGDQPVTGISLHWPEFDGTSGIPEGKDLNYFCNHDAVLKFHTEADPRSITRWTHKRDLFSASPSSEQATSPAAAAAADPAADHRRRQAANEARARQRSAARAHALVKSAHAGQSARALCGAATSAGPSFASRADRQFCHMVTKTLYPFCADVAAGEPCFDDAADALWPLGIGGSGNGTFVGAGSKVAAAAAGMPVVDFTSVTKWGY